MTLSSCLPHVYVHRRIGGLEIRELMRVFARRVHRRIGGLESIEIFGNVASVVHRRIGGLENLSMITPKN